MTNHIEAVLFDMGGTLRSSVKKDESLRLGPVGEIIDLLNADIAPDGLASLLSKRSWAYVHWARETLIELNERELWTKWMLPDWPVDQISELAIPLNQLWRKATGERIVFPESKEVVLKLFRRGYRLRLVSNTISSLETPQLLAELELTGCFETVILSCVVGMRKPDPAIMLEAARRMGIKTENCAYVGDRLNRDVEASRKAGFSTVVIRRNENFKKHQAKYPDLIADHYIDNLKDLLEIFPARQAGVILPPAFDASLSTMWAKKNFPRLSDFFDAARRMGYARIELNHQVDSDMLNGINLSKFQFSSVHEPCPADISTEELKRRDWLISSPEEDNRVQGVKAIKRSIDLAYQIHAPVIVVHCGMVSTDLGEERKMRQLFNEGKVETGAYREHKQNLIKRRAGLVGPRFDAVKKSLLELLEYAGPSAIRLGLENRYHYFDIPSLDEMGELLTLAGPDQLGFIYDVGHAQALDRLGFFPHEEWLRRYASRIIGVHLHDVRGVNDHFAPGLGEVDFDKVASYLPAEAYRTFELQPTNAPESVKAALKYLVEHGCVKPMSQKDINHARPL